MATGGQAQGGVFTLHGGGAIGLVGGVSGTVVGGVIPGTGPMREENRKTFGWRKGGGRGKRRRKGRDRESKQRWKSRRQKWKGGGKERD